MTNYELTKKHLGERVLSLQNSVDEYHQKYFDALDECSQSPDLGRLAYKDYYKSMLDMYEFALVELKTVLEIMEIEERKDS